MNNSTGRELIHCPSLPDLKTRGCADGRTETSHVVGFEAHEEILLNQRGGSLFWEAYRCLKLIGQRQQRAGDLKYGPPLAEQQDDLGALHRLVEAVPVADGRGQACAVPISNDDVGNLDHPSRVAQ